MSVFSVAAVLEATHDEVIISIIASVGAIIVAMINTRKRTEAALGANAKKMEEIHELVSSSTIVRMQNELDAVIVSLAMMKNVLQMQRQQGIEPTTESLELIRTTQERIIKLRGEIDELLGLNKTRFGHHPPA